MTSMTDRPGTDSSIFEKPTAALDAAVFDQPQTAGQEKIVADLQVVAEQAPQPTSVSTPASPAVGSVPPVEIKPVMAVESRPARQAAATAVSVGPDRQLLNQVQLARNQVSELNKLEELIG